MSDLVKNYIASIVALCPELSEEEISYLASGMSVTKYKAKDYYQQKGEPWKRAGYIISGIVRIFCYNSLGEEVTITFLEAGATISERFINPQALRANFYFQVIEDSAIIDISYPHIISLRERNVAFDRYIVFLSVQVSSYLKERLMSHLLEDAESRYLRFINERPELHARISVAHLCSYLGIKRQHLTHIRKKLLYP